MTFRAVSGSLGTSYLTGSVINMAIYGKCFIGGGKHSPGSFHFCSTAKSVTTGETDWI